MLALACVAGAMLLLSRAPAAEQALALRTVVDVPLTGGSSRFDYESLDAKRHLLFIAHLGASQVVVVDTKTNRVVKTISDLNQVHGVLAVPLSRR